MGTDHEYTFNHLRSFANRTVLCVHDKDWARGYHLTRILGNLGKSFRLQAKKTFRKICFTGSHAHYRLCGLNPAILCEAKIITFAARNPDAIRTCVETKYQERDQRLLQLSDTVSPSGTSIQLWRGKVTSRAFVRTHLPGTLSEGCIGAGQGRRRALVFGGVKTRLSLLGFGSLQYWLRPMRSTRLKLGTRGFRISFISSHNLRS